MVAVYIPEYVVGHWWEHLLHNQSALRLKSRLLFIPGVMVINVPCQLGPHSSLPRRTTTSTTSTMRAPHPLRRAPWAGNRNRERHVGCARPLPVVEGGLPIGVRRSRRRDLVGQQDGNSSLSLVRSRNVGGCRQDELAAELTAGAHR